MNTIVERFDGVDLIRPTGDFVWPHPTFDGFPECCGAGLPGSWGNNIVPEKIIGLNMAPACFIHDEMFANAALTWQGFHYSNAVFLCNLLNINETKGSNWLLRKLRGPIIMSWFTAVSSVAGATYFFKYNKRKDVEPC